MESEINGLIEEISSEEMKGLGATSRRRNIAKVAAFVNKQVAASATPQVVKHQINTSRLVNAKYQIQEFFVQKQNTEIAIDFQIKQEYREVKAIFVVCEDYDVARSVEINLKHKGVEILPEGFDLNLLTDRENVSQEDYAMPVQLEGSNSRMSGTLRVLDLGGDLAEPVSIKLYFVCKDDKTIER